jgi:hypothetical protein
MRRGLSAWWFAVPLVIALVSVVVGGVVIGYQLGAAGRVVAAEIDEIETVPTTGLRITFDTGENRTLFATDQGFGWSARRPASCTVTANDGQAAPDVTPISDRGRDGPTLEVNGVRWYPRLQIRAVEQGQLLITCDMAPGVRFALGPWVDVRDYAGFGTAGLVALAAMSFGLLVALTVAGVLFALWVTRRSAGPAPQGSDFGISTPLP